MCKVCSRSGPGASQVRGARLDDIAGIAALEWEVSAITCEPDYRYTIENQPGFWHVSVFENQRGEIDGWIISSGHPALNMLGPCVVRSEETAAALIFCELHHHPGRSPVFLVPVERGGLVRQVYEWGGRNCEFHFYQVRGEFRPFQGISMPTFLPETG